MTNLFLRRNTFYLVQQNDIFERRASFMSDAKLEALQIDNECKKFGSLNVLEKLVSHSNVDVCTLYQPRQVSNRYLQHTTDDILC